VEVKIEAKKIPTEEWQRLKSKIKKYEQAFQIDYPLISRWTKETE